jgi:hypothetical protein
MSISIYGHARAVLDGAYNDGSYFHVSYIKSSIFADPVIMAKRMRQFILVVLPALVFGQSDSTTDLQPCGKAFYSSSEV